jgi:ParB-like chromosome segregation protein Spo0J
MRKLIIKKVPLGEVQVYERNTKRHPADQVERIAESIDRFGFNDPVALHRGVLVEGHGRLMAARLLGLRTIPAIILPDDMSARDVDLYRIAHNKITLQTTFDFDRLVVDLREIMEQDISLEPMGFTEEEVNHLFSLYGPSPARGSDSSSSKATVYEVVHDNIQQKGRMAAFLKFITLPPSRGGKEGGMINAIERSGVLG